MQIVDVDITSLKPAEYNTREHSKKFKCDECGKVFGFCESTTRFKLGRNKHFFCSKECSFKYHRQAVFHTICTTCNKELEIPQYRKKEGRKYYCSRECRKTSVSILCQGCGEILKKKPSIIKTNNFCSRKCMGEWQSENLVGYRSPSWLGGCEKYYGSNWVKQARLARQRDEFICQKCGISELELGKSLDVHHKTPFRIFGVKNCKEANNLDNLTCLCPSCHSSIEPRKRS